MFTQQTAIVSLEEFPCELIFTLAAHEASLVEGLVHGIGAFASDRLRTSGTFGDETFDPTRKAIHEII